MKYLLIAYLNLASPNWTATVLDVFVSYRECAYLEGLNRYEHRNDKTVYIVCLANADI